MGILLISVFFIAVAASFFFLKENQKITNLHQQRLSALKFRLSLEKAQIDFRNKNLDKYDFCKYNLKEVLVVQS